MQVQKMYSQTLDTVVSAHGQVTWKGVAVRISDARFSRIMGFDNTLLQRLNRKDETSRILWLTLQTWLLFDARLDAYKTIALILYKRKIMGRKSQMD